MGHIQHTTQESNQTKDLAKAITLLDALLTKAIANHDSIEHLMTVVQEKLNPERKEFINDEDLLKMFGITQNIKYRMLKDGSLKQYKLNGKNSTSLYRYDEVVKHLEQNFIKS